MAALIVDDRKFLFELAHFLKSEYPNMETSIVRLRKIAVNLPVVE
jgi:hypothetical protein